MIDRSELIRDIIEHFTTKPGYAVFGPTLVDVLSGDIWNYDDTPFIDIISEMPFNNDGQIAPPMNVHMNVPNTTMQWQTLNNAVATANYMPVMADGEGYAQYMVPVRFHYPPGGGAVTVATPMIDVMRLRMDRVAIEQISVEPVANGDGSTAHIILEAMSKRFNILGALSQEEQTTVGRLVNRGWACPPEQLQGIAGALDAMVAIPIAGVDAGGVLPDIQPAVPLEPIPAMKMNPAAVPRGVRPGRSLGLDALEDRNLPPNVRKQIQEIRRVAQLRERFLTTHRTPDEKVAAAHGQEIGEYAQVHDPAGQGFGADGWS